MDNTTILVGNVTRDPELRFIPAGAASASFGLAVNRRWQNRQTQEWEEATSFFDIVCWRDLAENACESLHRGTRVIVTGRLEQRSYETEAGEKRSRIQLIADDLGPSIRWATAQVTKAERREVAQSTNVESSERRGVADLTDEEVAARIDAARATFAVEAEEEDGPF